MKRRLMVMMSVIVLLFAVVYGQTQTPKKLRTPAPVKKQTTTVTTIEKEHGVTLPKPKRCLLNVPLNPQETPVWCWAASSQMVMNFLDPGLNVTQCEEANRAVSRNDCCHNPTPGPCATTGWEMLSSYGFAFDQTSGTALSFTDLENQICTKKCPVMYAWGWTGGGGHMMVVTGTSRFLGIFKSVRINDPWPPHVGDRYWLSYDSWVSGPDHVTWANFYNVHKQIHFIKPKLELHQMLPPKFIEKIVLTPPKEYELSADQAVTQLREKMDDQEAKDMGFSSLQEAKLAKLGNPIREYHVSLNALKTFSKGTNAKKILSGGDTLLYPLVVNGQLKTSIRLTKLSGKTVTESYGHTNLIREIAAMPAASSLHQRKQTALPAVRVPALGLYFLADESGDQLKLAPIFDSPAMGLKKGVFEPATSVFERLKAFAAKAEKETM